MKRALPFTGLPSIAKDVIQKLRRTKEAISTSSAQRAAPDPAPRPPLRQAAHVVDLADSFADRLQHDREAVSLFDRLQRGAERQTIETPHKFHQPMSGNRSTFQNKLAPASARPAIDRMKVDGKQPGEKGFHRHMPAHIDDAAMYDIRLLRPVEWRQHIMEPHMAVQVTGAVLKEIEDDVAVAKLREGLPVR